MRTCYLKVGSDVREYELRLGGRGHIAVCTVCEGRTPKTGFFDAGPWTRFEIGKKVDHIGGRQNQSGAVYVANVLGGVPDSKPKDRTSRLF